MAALEAANPEVSPEDLQVGEEIIIPGSFGGSGNGTQVGNQTAPLNGTENIGGSENGTSAGNQTQSDQADGDDGTSSSDGWDITGWITRRRAVSQ